MKDIVLLASGFILGCVLVEVAFRVPVKALIFRTLDKTVAKIEGK